MQTQRGATMVQRRRRRIRIAASLAIHHDESGRLQTVDDKSDMRAVIR